MLWTVGNERSREMITCATQEEIAEAVGIDQKTASNQIALLGILEELPNLLKVTAMHQDADFAPPIYNQVKRIGNGTDSEARDRVKRFAENATPLNRHGTNQHGLDNYKVLSMATSSIDGGNDSEYLTARIARAVQRAQR